MNICYSSSDEFSIHTGISILSLLDNNQSVDKIHIYLLDLGISNENKEKLLSIVNRYNRKITFMPIDESRIKAFLSEEIPQHYGSYATYARLCATILFPEDVDRILYIDSDMVIAGSLAEIYNMEMGDRIVACVPQKRDALHMEASSHEEAEIVRLNPLYMNAGLLLINVSNWRKFNFNEQVKQTVKGMHDFHNKDQSILNKTLTLDQIARLPFKYNYTMHRYPQYLLKSWAKKAAPLTVDEVMEAAKAPVVIHYCGDQARPWYKENTSVCAGEYYRYKKMSPFSNVPLESIFESGKYRNTSAVAKTFMSLYYKYHQKRIGFPLFVINETRIRMENWLERKRKK